MNPNLSVDGLFSLSQFNRPSPLTFDGGHDPHQTGFNLQQVELSLNSNVDPYLKADANLVLTPDGIEIEEAYVTTLQLPGSFQVKGGQFFTGFGRGNPTHPHAWDFVNKPLVLGRFFGGDGLRNPGVQASWLSPLPWYSELIVSAQNSTGDTAASFQPSGTMRALNESLALARWSNFVAVNESLSLNGGLSYLTGKNASQRQTQIFGADIYAKFRRESSLSFLSFQAEALKRIYRIGPTDPSDWGGYAQVNFRLPEPWHRWHLGLRYDFVSEKNQVPVQTAGTESIEDPANPGSTIEIDRDQARRWRFSPVVTFFPSEFSKLRLQYEFDRPAHDEHAQQVVSLQLEFLMGAHGAHQF